ncbi:hypothetical protein F1559_003500 [Cyanidiococcus yangmingshanensis]|uniref:OTU domain-containing protein n=1 Tax=Cyanidiococcus yangmingshanensis TaxID=2690220 RepID=A0A7J7IFZ4_9RHOD|nr:hypothetical protein F1559_003500 [Cyanidiococcus yangmingshanensis]
MGQCLGRGDVRGRLGPSEKPSVPFAISSSSEDEQSLLFPRLNLKRIEREVSGLEPSLETTSARALVPRKSTATRKQETFADVSAPPDAREDSLISNRLSKSSTRSSSGSLELEALTNALADLEEQVSMVRSEDSAVDLLCHMADLRREMVIVSSLRHPRRAQRIHSLLLRLESLIQRLQVYALRDASPDAFRRVRESARGVLFQNGAAARVRPVTDQERHAIPHRYLSFNSATFYDSGAVLKRESTMRDMSGLLRVDRTIGDGRCLFRSVARGLAFHAGLYPGPKWTERRERREADMLRYLCVREMRKHRDLFLRDQVIEGDFDEHLRRLLHSDEFAGEPELLVLGPLLLTPICVYMDAQGGPEARASTSAANHGEAGDQANVFLVVVYGRSFVSEPVNIRYRSQHYDLLLPRQSPRYEQP